MALPRKLIHNLEKVADDMIDFIMNSKNNAELVELIEAVRSEYKEPLESIIWWPIYSFFRVRGPELDQLALVAREHKAGRELLARIVDLLETGGKKSTSARMTLVYELLSRLPNYQKVDPNPVESLTAKEVKELRHIFKAKAKNIIESVKGDLTQKDGVMQELNNLPKRDIRQAGVQLPAGSLYKPKPQMDVKKLDDAKFGELKLALTSLYQNRNALLPFTSNKVSPRVLIAPVQVVAPDETIESVADIYIVAPTPPPPPPVHQFANGARAAADIKYKNQTEVYQAPPRKKFTQEQCQAAMSFFAPKSEPVIVKGTCDDNVVSVIAGYM